MDEQKQLIKCMKDHSDLLRRMKNSHDETKTPAVPIISRIEGLL